MPQGQTRFRGRDYVAWYTEEIPLPPMGPYKFGGLPGLITCIYDTQREHIYTLVGFEKAPALDYIYYGNGRRKPTEAHARRSINSSDSTTSSRISSSPTFSRQPLALRSTARSPSPTTPSSWNNPTEL